MSVDQASSRPVGATVVNRGRIRRHPAAIFELLADPEREREWNEKLLEVERLTAGPLGAGSQFRARFPWPVGESVITYDAVDAPHSWSSRSTSRRLNVHLFASITETDGLSEVTLSTTLQPRGLLRLLRPMVATTMQRSWDYHLQRVDQLLATRDPS